MDHRHKENGSCPPSVGTGHPSGRAARDRRLGTTLQPSSWPCVYIGSKYIHPVGERERVNPRPQARARPHNHMALRNGTPALVGPPLALAQPLPLIEGIHPQGCRTRKPLKPSFWLYTMLLLQQWEQQHLGSMLPLPGKAYTMYYILCSRCQPMFQYAMPFRSRGTCPGLASNLTTRPLS